MGTVVETAVRAASTSSSTETLERRVHALTNRYRQKRGCRPLTLHANLRVAARRHTAMMVRHRTMSHQLRGEAGLGRRITNAGYTRWRLVAENVARGFSSADSVMRAWMNSTGHRRNILDCRLKHIGVGVSYAHGHFWWTQNFGVRH